MGSCLSCFCGGRFRSAERDPLLPKVSQPSDPPPRFPLEKALDILAAFQTGKLPSQDQLNRILQCLLNAKLLRPGSEAPLSHLSHNGRRILSDTRMVLESLLRLGMEKNMDDRFQDLLLRCSQVQGVPLHVSLDNAVVLEAGSKGFEQLQSEVPSRREVMQDSALLVDSIKQVIRLLFSSVAFRIFLSDLFSSTRETIARIAAEVGNTAMEVQVAAESVERTANLEATSLKTLSGGIIQAAETIKTGIEEAEVKSAILESTRDKFVTRVQEFIIRAHHDRQHLDSLRSLFHILHKYIVKISYSAEVVAGMRAAASADASSISMTPDSDIAEVLEDAKVLLERLASGHSIEPLLHALADVITSITLSLQPSSTQKFSDSGETLQQYVHSVDCWLNCALSPTPPSQPLYATSRSGTHTLERLFDDGYKLLFSSASTETNLKHHLNKLLDAYGAYVDALAHDKSTMQLLDSISTLQADISSFISASDSIRAGNHVSKWKDEILSDILGYVLPHVMKVIGHIGVPMPRAEYKSGEISGALDAVKMGPNEAGGVFLDVLPDQIVVTTSNEVRIDMEEGSSLMSSHRIHIHVDGIRMAIKELGYFFAYGKGPVFRYKDQGLLNVDLGFAVNMLEKLRPQSLKGISIDAALVLDTPRPASSSDNLSPTSRSAPRLFDVQDVHVSLRRLQFSIDRSRHYIINKLFIQPLAGPVITRIVTDVLENQLRGCLETLATGIAALKQEAERISINNCPVGEQPEATISDYLTAFLVKGPQAFGTLLCDSEPETDAEVQTSTTSTLKGVIHTSTSIADHPSSSKSPTEEETFIAIGVGPMIVPDTAGAYGSDANEERGLEERVAQSASEVAGDIEAAVDKGITKAAELVNEVGESKRRIERRRESEGETSGWRSLVFEIDVL